MSGLKDQVSSERQAPPTFRRREGVSFAPRRNSISTHFYFHPFASKTLSLIAPFETAATDGAPATVNLIHRTFLSFPEFSLTLLTLLPSLPVLDQICYIARANNFCTILKTSHSFFDEYHLFAKSRYKFVHNFCGVMVSLEEELDGLDNIIFLQLFETIRCLENFKGQRVNKNRFMVLSLFNQNFAEKFDYTFKSH